MILPLAALPTLLVAVQNITSPPVALSLPTSPPPTAQPLDPYLAGFSLEQESWPSWAGKLAEPNAFIQQLLRNLQDRTGVPPAIRIGGSSLDCSWLDNATQYVRSTFPPPREHTPYPGASYVAVGRDFYALAANFAPGTRFTFGVPLKPFQLNETTAQAAQIAAVFQGNRSSILNGQVLEYLEIGNEPNYWGLPSWWSPANYTQTFNRYAKAISSVLTFSAGQTELLAGSFTGTAGMYPWSGLGSMGQGIFTDPEMGAVVGGWSQHKYNGQNDGQKDVKPGSLDGKSSVRGNLAQLFVDAQAVRSAGKKYILGETNSYSNHGLPGTSNTAESVLFGVDHMLYGATMGISRMYFHNGVGYHYSSLAPESNLNDGYNLTRPHIGALYHAYLIVNEAIGTSGASSIAEMATSDNRIVAYGIWENGWLARAVFINSEPFTVANAAEGGGGRKEVTVRLQNPMASGGNVRWFETQYTNSSRGMRWAGQDFDTPDGKAAGQVKETKWDGKSITLPATSIAVVSFW